VSAGDALVAARRSDGIAASTPPAGRAGLGAQHGAAG
jgi:hypothetical protein